MTISRLKSKAFFVRVVMFKHLLRQKFSQPALFVASLFSLVLV